jgi:hypothetical protein
MPRILTLCLPSSGLPGILVRGRGPALKGNCVASISNLRTFANSAGVPIVVFVDMQQEYLAKPRLQAISEIDHAPDNCRRVLDHAFAGESACLSTSVDAVHRSPKAAYLRGASASHAPDDSRRHDSRRNPPRGFEDFPTLWRGTWNDRLERRDLTSQTR